VAILAMTAVTATVTARPFARPVRTRRVGQVLVQRIRVVHMQGIVMMVQGIGQMHMQGVVLVVQRIMVMHMRGIVVVANGVLQGIATA